MGDVWAELKAQTTERIPRAAQDFAEIRAELNTLEGELSAQFGRYQRVRAILEDGGVLAQFKLNPILDAAHGAWLRDQETPRRLEITELTEAPIPPEEAA